MSLLDRIRVDYSPTFSLDRAAAALNVVGASSSASRASLPAGTYKYIAPLTGSDAAAGDIGTPWKTITKHNLSGGSNIGVIVEAGTITLGTGAETDKAITRSLQAAVEIAPPEIAISGAWTPAANADGLGNDPVCVGHNGAKYLIADNIGELRQSTSGTSWSTVTEAINTYADFIVYGAGVWVVGGGGGDLASSADGNTFTARTPATGWSTSNCTAAAYGHLGFLIGSDDGKFMSSTDGTNWSLLTTPDGWGTREAVSIHYADGKYVVLSASSDGVSKTAFCMVSDDLENFYFSNYVHCEIVPVGWQGTSALAYGNGVWSMVHGYSFFRSYDALDWEEVATPDDSVNWRGVAFGGGYFLAYGVRTYARSSDGENWTTFASSHASLFSAVYATFGPNGWLVVGSGVANGVETFPGAVKISASVAGLSFANAGAYVAGLSGAGTIQNCTFDEGLDVLPGSYALTVKNSILSSLRASRTFFGTFSENVVSGVSDWLEALNASSYVDRNTFAGRLTDRQVAAYSPAGFRDNILDGGIRTNRILTINGGNVRGAVVGATLSDSVSSFAPLFIDSAGGDFRLRRRSDGFAFGSRLCEVSENFAPNGTAGTGRDLGAYSFDYSAEVQDYALTVWLPRPDVGNVTFAIDPSTSFDPVLDGEPIGTIDPSAHLEEIVCRFDDIDATQLAGLKAILAQSDARVRLNWRPDDAVAGSVVANGARSAGDPYVVIDAADLSGASAIRVGGVDYRILRASPSPSAATVLLLDSDLAVGVSDNDSIDLVGQAGIGEYVVRFPERIEGAPDLSTLTPDDLSGISISFARQLP